MPETVALSESKVDREADDETRYDFAVDVDSQSAHAKTVRLVGRDKRVLELGCASGHMTQVLRDRGCRVVAIELDPVMANRARPHCERLIVGDLDRLDLSEALGDDRFDVIVAADVLAHLKDPWAVLRSLKRFLRPGGYAVVSLPNVAHGSVRLALLEGQFPYKELGLLESTHLRFFTLRSLTRLFEESDFAITHLERQELMIDRSEVTFNKDNVPPELFESLASDPESRTYQYLVEAHPLPEEGKDWIKPHLRDLAGREQEAREALAACERKAERTAAEMRQALSEVRDRHAEIVKQLDAMTLRERELRVELVDAHDQLLRHDDELMGHIRELTAQRNQLAARFERLRRSLPGKTYRGLKKILNMARG
ncbi:Ubiquinone biosynthesis O-methyltransferase [Aquisphaera giovannonii]|uniref:Ubiquinone biosynthesis O-methyltransferase n=1 Tax=Aquisphaera giovannonii TaxID=406548 RepID=A0A5B9W948_9BACT|nr:class I SAM-dependent methyltransferase [Aquisphaera giovannonii]QEH36937.1 Ubiquinone biosynthesis O-methyltransferase [Aquisphaera giovannonii]